MMLVNEADPRSFLERLSLLQSQFIAFSSYIASPSTALSPFVVRVSPFVVRVP